MSNSKINNEVKDFQKKLDSNEENKHHFVHAEVDSDSEEVLSDDDCSPAITISHSKKKNSDKDPISNKMFQRLLEQQEALAKAQKLVYKLKSDLNTEEIQARYVKLDLNNAQVKIEELETRQKDIERQLYNSRTENYASRGIICVYLLWMILSTLGLLYK